MKRMLLIGVSESMLVCLGNDRSYPGAQAKRFALYIIMRMNILGRIESNLDKLREYIRY